MYIHINILFDNVRIHTNLQYHLNPRVYHSAYSVCMHMYTVQFTSIYVSE